MQILISHKDETRCKIYIPGFQTALEVTKKADQISEQPKKSPSPKRPAEELKKSPKKESKPEPKIDKAKDLSDKTRNKLKMLGLSDDDSDFENEPNNAEVDYSSETSSSPEMDEKPDIAEPEMDQPETEMAETETEVIPTHHPKEPPPEVEEEIVQDTQEQHDEKVAKLEETIKNLQQQMAEGNDHIAYEQKVRKENRNKEIKETTAATLSKAFKPPRKVSPQKAKKEEKLEKRRSHHSSPQKRTSPDKAKNKIKVRVELENKKSLKTEKSPHKHSSKEAKIKVKTPEKSRKSLEPIKGLSPIKKPLNTTQEDTPNHKKEKKEVADVLVKLLVPHFKKGNIASKDVFKVSK